MKLAHRKCIEHAAIEPDVLIGNRRRGLAFLGIARRRQQNQGVTIHAQAVLHGKLDKTFRVDCSGEVVMKISTLGHLGQKRMQQRRLVTNGFEMARGLLLGRSCRRRFALTPDWLRHSNS